jgi:hypothetical protein
MLKLRLTHKRAKRWGRRAKSDGSCVPRIKRIKPKNHIQIIHICNWIVLTLSAIAVVVGGLWYLTFELGGRGLLFIFGIQFDVFAFVSFTLKYAWIFFAYVLVCQVLNVFIVVKIRALKKIAVAGRCYLCPRCSYDLSQRTDDTHPCPECGQRISRRECIRLWARFCR